MTEILSKSDYQQWALNKDLTERRAIYLRAALRSLPVTVQEIDDIPTFFSSPWPRLTLFQMLRGLYSSWLIAHRNDSRSAQAISITSAGLGVDNLAHDAKSATRAAAWAAYGAAHLFEDTDTGILDAIKAAYYADGGDAFYPMRSDDPVLTTALAPRTAWLQITQDCMAVDRGTSGASLVELPLWTVGPPAWFEYFSPLFTSRLAKMGDDWELWARWYLSRVKGTPSFGLSEDAAAEVDRLASDLKTEEWDFPLTRLRPAILEATFGRGETPAESLSDGSLIASSQVFSHSSQSVSVQSSTWTGISNLHERVVAFKQLAPIALASVESLMMQIEVAGHNGGPPLAEREEAIAALRELHRSLGALLQAAEQPNYSWVDGEGLAASCASYAIRAHDALRNDPIPFAASGLLLALFTTFGFPGVGGWLSAAALMFNKRSHSEVV